MTGRIRTSAAKLALVGAFAVVSSLAVAQTQGPTAKIAGWTAEARRDAGGELTGCQAKAPPGAEGEQLLVMVWVDYQWMLAIGLPSRELEADKPLPIDITFDGQAHYHLFGVPQDKHVFGIEMQRGAIAEQFRRSERLAVSLDGKTMSFSLAGTRRIIPALNDCVRNNGTLPGATQALTLYYGDENADYGVAPQDRLQKDVGRATPVRVPGVPTVTTTALIDAMHAGRPLVLIDALDSQHRTIKGAVQLPVAGNYGGGTFDDAVQNVLVDDLEDLRREHPGAELVFFCEGVRCWESYNAVLRARAAGVDNVSWYRGGLTAWKAAGLPMEADVKDPAAAKRDAAPGGRDEAALPPPGDPTNAASGEPIDDRSAGSSNAAATSPAGAWLAAFTGAGGRRSAVHYGNEEVDFGVPAQTTLQREVGTATPLTVPGVPTITTTELMNAVRAGKPMVLVDALKDGHAKTLPAAVSMPFAGAYGEGSFGDQTQAVVAKALHDVLKGREDVPVIAFCAGARCWESYNAVLRARAAGVRNIAWYRGGLAAWKAAGFPLHNRRSN